MTQSWEQVLQALQAAREEHPDLADWLDFQRELLTVQRAAEPALLPLAQPVTSERVDARKEAGQPLFTFDELEVDWLVLYGLVSQLEEIAARSLPDWPASGRVEIAEEAVRSWYAGQSSPDAHIAFLICHALQPFLRRAAQASRTHLSAGAYRQWGQCPVCGGVPDFAVLEQESGGRLLFCSRCDSGWHYRRIGCPFCGTENPRSLAYFAGDNGAYRLYVCDECRGYVKTLDLRETIRPFVLAVERILTAGMDLAATEAGYRCYTSYSRMQHPEP